MLNINAPATIGSAPIHRAARTRRKWPLENSNASPVTRRHDGFTLNDLVSYDRKHNEQNGEDNRDGSDDNRSWNGGGEEPTDDLAIEKLRSRRSAPDTEPQPYRVPP